MIITLYIQEMGSKYSGGKEGKRGYRKGSGRDAPQIKLIAEGALKLMVEGNTTLLQRMLLPGETVSFLRT